MASSFLMRTNEVVNKSGDHVWSEALAKVPTVGDSQKLRSTLEHRLLGRHNVDPIILSGAFGSGRWHTTQLCHHYFEVEQSAQLIRLAPWDVSPERLSECVAQGRTTLYFENFDQLEAPLFQSVLMWIQQHSEDPQLLIVLSVQEASHQLLTRLAPPWRLETLAHRSRDIEALGQHFVCEALSELGFSEHRGLTSQAKSDLCDALLHSTKANLHNLRRAMRDSVFALHADRAALPALVHSSRIETALIQEFNYNRLNVQKNKGTAQVEHQFSDAWQDSIAIEIARRHHVRLSTLRQWVDATEAMLNDMDDQAPTYRNVVERTSKLNKIALWLHSEAVTQAEFRRYFGERSGDMPTKSVAHQIFYEVFPKDESTHTSRPPSGTEPSALRRELESMFGDALPKVGSGK